MNSNDQNHGKRIKKLEEAIGFSDRQIEILSDEVAQINQMILALSRRFTQIEARLSELNHRVAEDPGNVPPPHSAGPDVSKDPL